MRNILPPPFRFLAVTLPLSALLMGCQPLSNSPENAQFGGIWEGTYPTSTGVPFRVELAQDGGQLSGGLEALAEFPHGHGHEYIGAVTGKIQGSEVHFTVYGANGYAGRTLEFAGRLNGGELAGVLTSRIEPRIASGQVKLKRR
ncbi:hypothetical protein [Deinococcus hopiensis]|uniref:Lipoprotein n=1 Tax=Deinococcus hopiensis KR-140 TaxID=695939 RepID=A0A1W1UPZ5_9DEIO|nr:hypothetical protein [Deinococcus hopiensis]SMB83167.1 hypothetical protein SAMN00790413_04287 [Deinococcus hopiensis KR-140]